MLAQTFSRFYNPTSTESIPFTDTVSWDRPLKWICGGRHSQHYVWLHCQSISGDHHPDLANAVRSLPLDKLLLERDSPYLVPPSRTSCNPGMLPEIAEGIAKLKQLPVPVILETSRWAA